MFPLKAIGYLFIFLFVALVVIIAVLFSPFILLAKYLRNRKIKNNLLYDYSEDIIEETGEIDLDSKEDLSEDNDEDEKEK